VKSPASARSALRSCVRLYTVTEVSSDWLEVGDIISMRYRPTWALRYLRRLGRK
jgi:hypothetical protein